MWSEGELKPLTRNPMKRILLLSFTLSVLACANEKAPVTAVETKRSSATNNDVTAARLADGIRLNNQGGTTIRYIARNEGWLGLLAGCHYEPSTCATLGAGKSVVITAADIHGFYDQAPALEVWYWEEGSNEPAPQSIRLPLN